MGTVFLLATSYKNRCLYPASMREPIAMTGKSRRKIKLMIADDQVMLLGGMKLLLSKFDDFEVVASVDDVEEILPTYKETGPDVVISDVMFDPSRSAAKTGIDALAEILSYDKNANVILYSQFDDEENIQRAYSSGAKAFLTKDIDVDEMALSIREAYRGEVFFTEEIARRLAAISVGKSHKSEKSPKHLLGKRQLSIFILAAQGYTQTEIAKKLYLHQRTITSEMAKLKNILGIERQAEMTKLAIKHKLIDTDEITY